MDRTPGSFLEGSPRPRADVRTQYRQQAAPGLHPSDGQTSPESRTDPSDTRLSDAQLSQPGTQFSQYSGHSMKARVSDYWAGVLPPPSQERSHWSLTHPHLWGQRPSTVHLHCRELVNSDQNKNQEHNYTDWGLVPQSHSPSPSGWSSFGASGSWKWKLAIMSRKASISLFKPWLRSGPPAPASSGLSPSAV